MPSAIEEIITELADNNQPLLDSRLADLSNLNSAEMELPKQLWLTIERERRRQIISRLVELAENHFELDFDSIFQDCLTDEDAEWLFNNPGFAIGDDVDPPVLLGDVNLDEDVNGLDVDPFVDVLLNGPFQIEADMNKDGEVNGLDVDPFVAAVVGGGVAAVPEPSTLALALGLALLGAGMIRRRR